MTTELLGNLGQSTLNGNIGSTDTSISVVSGASFPGGVTNLVGNPTMEGGITGWNSYQGATLTQDSGTVHAGTYSLKVVTPGTHSDCEGASSDPASGAATGDEVNGGAWVYCPNGVHFQIDLDEYSSGPSYLRTTITNFTGTGAWQWVSTGNVTLGASTTLTSLAIYTRAGETIAATFYVDDADIHKTAAVTGQFRVTCEDEIMLCTARSGNTLTVTRGQESTTPVSHSSGATIAHTLTKAGLDAYLPQVSQPLDATLTALAGANWAANSLAIGSGTDTMAQVTFAANTFPARASTGNLVAKSITDFGLSLVDDADAGAARATLGATTFSTLFALS